MIADRAPPNKLRRVEINFGHGTKAKRYYERLVSIMPLVKHTLEKLGNKDHADLLNSWQHTLRYRIAEAPHWIVELNAMEWQALSRGLRAQGTRGRSFYEWVQRHHTRYYHPRLWSGGGRWPKPCNHSKYRNIAHPDGGGGEVPFCPTCNKVVEL